jgi:Ni,Fe-hydrogenase III small subunit
MLDCLVNFSEGFINPLDGLVPMAAVIPGCPRQNCPSFTQELLSAMHILKSFVAFLGCRGRRAGCAARHGET